MRDTFMRPDLLAKAKALGAAELGNVALLFYTKKDEEGGQGYEFLHKSFGEYLTACGLLGAFMRWGQQVADGTLDFDSSEYLRKWLALSGPTPITFEIISFLRNEVRLRAAEEAPKHSWMTARNWVRIAETLINEMAIVGVPAHEKAKSWRAAEVCERNSEISLMAILDACARAAYPEELMGKDPMHGGWQVGPIRIPAFEQDTKAFGAFLYRLTDATATGYRPEKSTYPIVGPTGIILKMLSRLDLPGVDLSCHVFLDADLFGCNFEAGMLAGTMFHRSNIQSCDFRGADLSHAVLQNAKVKAADFRGAIMMHAVFDLKEMKQATTDEISQTQRAPGNNVRAPLPLRVSLSVARPARSDGVGAPALAPSSRKASLQGWREPSVLQIFI